MSFIRAWSLRIDTVDVSDLAMTFKVTKNLKPEPNQAEITVRNLNLDTRKRLETPKTLDVVLLAGYANPGAHAIFTGTVRSASTQVDGADILTTIATGDKEAAIGQARVSAALPAGATPQTVAKTLASSMGVGLGSLPAALAKGGISGIATVLHGSASANMTAVMRSVGHEWSIQDGTLQVLAQGASLTATAVLLSSDTGLIGSPTIDTKGVLSCRALILPDLQPGRLVRIKSRFISGDFRIEEAQYSGDTHGNPWYVDLHCRRRT